MKTWSACVWCSLTPPPRRASARWPEFGKDDEKLLRKMGRSGRLALPGCCSSCAERLHSDSTRRASLRSAGGLTGSRAGGKLGRSASKSGCRLKGISEPAQRIERKTAEVLSEPHGWEKGRGPSCQIHLTGSYDRRPTRFQADDACEPAPTRCFFGPGLSRTGQRVLCICQGRGS